MRCTTRGDLSFGSLQVVYDVFDAETPISFFMLGLRVPVCEGSDRLTDCTLSVDS